MGDINMNLFHEASSICFNYISLFHSYKCDQVPQRLKRLRQSSVESVRASTLEELSWQECGSCIVYSLTLVSLFDVNGLMDLDAKKSF